MGWHLPLTPSVQMLKNVFKGSDTTSHFFFTFKRLFKNSKNSSGLSFDVQEKKELF